MGETSWERDVVRENLAKRTWRAAHPATTSVLGVMTVLLGFALIFGAPQQASAGPISNTTTAVPALDELTDSPTTATQPVTQDDFYDQYYAGNTAKLDILGNDTDPLGRPMRLCWISETPFFAISFAGDDLTHAVLRLDTHNHGTLVATYQVTPTNCDDMASMSTATVTVVVNQAHVRVKKVKNHPGFVKAVNKSGLTVKIKWAASTKHAAFRHTKIKPHKSVLLNAKGMPTVFWWTLFRANGQLVQGDWGQVRGAGRYGYARSWAFSHYRGWISFGR